VSARYQVAQNLLPFVAHATTRLALRVAADSKEK
jgi:hypothetical protein